MKKITKHRKQGCGTKHTHEKLSTSARESLAHFLDKYLQHLAVKGFSESTLRVRRVHMEMFLKGPAPSSRLTLKGLPPARGYASARVKNFSPKLMITEMMKKSARQKGILIIAGIHPVFQGTNHMRGI
jgi:hypothetical protein